MKPVVSTDSVVFVAPATSPETTFAPLLEIRLFGPTRVLLAGETLPPLRTRKGLQLLAFLALRQGQPVDRDYLAGVLWPDSLEAQALASLRRALTDLRAALGTSASLLTAPTPRTLVLHLPESIVFLDVRAFENAIKQGDEIGLREAVDLYPSALLEDCAEEWALRERRMREESFLSVLERLSGMTEQDGNLTDAVHYQRRLIACDPLREEAHGRLMRLLAAGGDYAAAVQVYRDLRLKLYEALNTEPSAEITGVYRQIRERARAVAEGPRPSLTPNVYAVRSAVPAESEPVTPDPTRKVVLPAPITRFIGRGTLLRELCESLRGTRLLTLTGIGGIGKTRLAVEAGRTVQDDFRAGVFFVDLSALTDETLVVSEVARTLEIGEEAGVPLSKTLMTTLADRERLLILDNCEHLSEACATLAAELLTNCPKLTLLATSRAPLGVPGETLLRLPALTVPTEKDGPEAIQQTEAVKLFLERAKQYRPLLDNTPTTLKAISEICRHLDGLPFALEIAASRLAVMTPVEINTHLTERFRLLTGGGRMVQPRQKTLRSLLDWSHDLLTDAERVLLRRLAVFPGSFSREAVAEICFDEPVSAWDALEVLSPLVEKSLALAETGGEGTETRYRLYETVREYSRERLATAGETAKVTGQHGAHFSEMVRLARQTLGTQEQASSFRRLASEQDNLRGALEMFLTSDENQTIIAGQRMVTNLSPFWAMRNHLNEGQRWCKRAIDQIPRTMCEADVSQNHHKLYVAAGILARRQGDYALARHMQEAALEICRTLDDTQGMAVALGNLALIAENQGDYTAAQDYRARGLAYERQHNRPGQVALFLHNAAHLAHRLGDLTTARAQFEEALALRQGTGDVEGRAWTLLALADTLQELREVGQTTPEESSCIAGHLEEALACMTELGDREGMILVRVSKFYDQEYVGRWETARRELSDALALLAETEGFAPATEPIEAAANFARTYGDARSATLLQGALFSLCAGVEVRITPKEDAKRKEALDALRQALGENAYQAAYAAGERLTLAEAVTLAQRVLEANSTTLKVGSMARVPWGGR